MERSEPKEAVHKQWLNNLKGMLAKDMSGLSADLKMSKDERRGPEEIEQVEKESCRTRNHKVCLKVRL